MSSTKRNSRNFLSCACDYSLAEKTTLSVSHYWYNEKTIEKESYKISYHINVAESTLHIFLSLISLLEIIKSKLTWRHRICSFLYSTFT